MGMSIDSLNAMEQDEFVQALGHVFEHSPWFAERVSAMRPFERVDALHAAFQLVVLSADEERKLALLRGHPDLAGKAARAGDLTDDSRAEQAGAGLDRLSDEEFERFHALNEAYKEKFGFPFIVAVKGLSKEDILQAYARRVEHDRSQEFETALGEVLKIARFRVDDLIAG